MTIYGITYSSGNMDKSAELCRQSMLKHGVTFADIYRPEFLSPQFKEDNAYELSHPRGSGYWMWKSRIIMDMMLTNRYADYYIYMDAGVELTGSVQHIINAMDQDIFLFSNGWPHVHWCKMDVMQAVLPGHIAIENDIAKQVQASVIIIKNTQFARDFIKEWLLYCQMPGLIDDSPSKYPNHPQFADHRHDQAILTCLQIKHNIKTHYWPEKHWDNQRHRWPDDTYPIMFLQHRKRDKGKGLGDVEWPD